MCGGRALDLFEPLELELLISGNLNLNFFDLQAGTNYEDGFEANSVSIHHFWEVIHSFNETEKKQFLQFISGRFVIAKSFFIIFICYKVIDLQ